MHRRAERTARCRRHDQAGQTVQEVRCDDPALRIFGVSLAGWDMVASAALGLYAALATRFAR